MRFKRIEYMSWAKRMLADPPAFNLAESGIQSAAPADIGLDPPVSLPVSGMNYFGHPGLIERLATLYGVATERVLPAAGTSLANWLVPAALLEPGDLVLVERPAYEPLWRVVEGLAAEVRFVDRPADRGHALDLDQVAEGLAAGARLVVVSNLHNPTCVLMPRQTLAALDALAARHDAWVLVDEVYLPGVLGPDEPFPHSAAGTGERLIVTCSLTKIYGLGGLRAGWAIAPGPIVERCRLINDHLGVNAPFLSDAATCMALDRLPALRQRARERHAANWPLVTRFAEAHQLRYAPPAGAFVVWLELPDGRSADALCEAALAEQRVLVTPGRFFGSDRHVRLGFGAPTEEVAEGLERLGWVL